jgi:Rrf2 family protein
MAHNSRFAVGVHIMALLAWLDGEPAKSDYIAGSVGTNPVVVRRILGSLARAGLVTSRPGSTGGYRLSDDPATVTLRRIYLAVDEARIFDLHPLSPATTCPVAIDIQPALSSLIDDAESTVSALLGQTTLAEMMHAIRTPTRGDYRRAQAAARHAEPLAASVGS